MSEDLVLRVLTGRIAGYFMMRELNRVAFITLDNPLCVALSAAAASSFLDRTGGWVKIYTYNGVNHSEILDDVEKSNIQALFLAFGGESEEVIKTRLTSFLEEIAVRNLEVDIILHVRAYAVGGLQAAIQNKEVKFYLQGSNNLYVYTVDFDNGFLILNITEIHEDHFHLEEIERFPLTLEHARLLNKSFKNRILSWQQED